MRLWASANAWFSNEEEKKGQIMVGQLADLALLSEDYFSVAEDEIPHLHSVLTLVGGRIVHGSGNYSGLAPPIPAPMPDWSPVAVARDERRIPASAATCGCATTCGIHGHQHRAAVVSPVPTADPSTFWGAFGCACWAV